MVALFTGACRAGGSASADAIADGGSGDGPFADAAPVTDASGSADSTLEEEDTGLGPGDAGTDAPPSVSPAITILTSNGSPLQGAPGGALPLLVVFSWSDGGIEPISDDRVTWLAPLTVVAEDPSDAGADLVPAPTAEPTAFFVRNDYGQDNPGVLYITDPGTVVNPTILVRVSVLDAGEASAAVSILPPLMGDPARGETQFLHGPECGTCHGPSGGGSPPALLDDGGPLLIDGGPAYAISGQLYAYPAPGLNNAPDSGNLASDPTWTAALLGMAAQAGIDNRGVALRKPMPDWLGGTNATGGTLGAQDFADIYAWLRTQTK